MRVPCRPITNKRILRWQAFWRLLPVPLAFCTSGWRYGLAAIVVFPSVSLVVAFLLPVPSWLLFVNLPVLAVINYRICEKLNNLVDEGQHRGAVASKTLPVAVFAMTSSLPLLAAVNSAVMGVTTAGLRTIYRILSRARIRSLRTAFAM